jgi:hypothetical protein
MALGIVSTAIAASAFAGTPTINGVLDAAAGYEAIAGLAAPGDRTGFGGAIDASQIWFTTDTTNLYFFVQGKVDTSNDNGILFLLNTGAETGAAAGTSLGGSPGGHCLGNAGNPNWKMEFEVDHAWVGNPGGGSNFYIDAKNYVGGPTAGYSGNPGLTGGALADGFLAGAQHAMDNAGNSGGPGNSTGWEIAIPRSALGNITGQSVQAFAIVVSSSAFFSDDSAPATIGPGNPGFNPDFPVIGGTQASTIVFAPVSLSAFGVE